MAIARTRGGEGTGHVTRSVLRGERTYQILLDLDADGERAVYYQPRDYATIVLPADVDRECS